MASLNGETLGSIRTFLCAGKAFVSNVIFWLSTSTCLHHRVRQTDCLVIHFVRESRKDEKLKQNVKARQKRPGNSKNFADNPEGRPIV